MWAGALWSRGDPGGRGSCRYTGVSWGLAASPAWKPGSVRGGGWGRHRIPSGTCQPRLSPQVRRPALSPRPAKGGVWPARGAGGGQAREIPSISRRLQGTGSRSSGARLPGCRREGPGLPDATSSWDRVEKPRPERASWSRKRTWDWKCSSGGLYSEVFIWVWG